MLVDHAMTRGLVGIDTGATVSEAAVKMSEREVGILIVFNINRVSGVLTDRDIVVRSVASAFDPAHTLVEEVMTKNIIWCRGDFPLETATDLMAKNRIRRLLVVDPNYQPSGILSIGDVAKNVIENVLSTETLSRFHQVFDHYPNGRKNKSNSMEQFS